MRRFLIVAAYIAALPSMARSQAEARPPASSDSTPPGPTSSSFTFRVGGFTMNGQRNYAFNKSVQSGTGSLKGIEVLLRGGAVGLSARSLTGTFTTQPSGAAQPDVTSADVNLLLGPPAFTVSVGASKRALTNNKLGVTQVYTFGRVGAQMSFLIGGSGMRGQVGAWGYVPSSTDADRMKIGGEGEGSIIYSPPRIPIYLQLGYRTEVFTAKTLTTQTPEEVRGLRLGGGIQFGGK